MLELTEHTVIDRPEQLLASLADLRARGARIAVDDAGSGYAGLALLLALRPDIVKLDQALVRGLDVDPAKRALVRAFGELADSIDAWVLAEGIETLEELEELVTLEVPLGQGYLLGRPQAGFTVEIPLALATTIHGRVARGVHRDLIVTLQERAPTGRPDESPSVGSLRIVLDPMDRPVAIELGDGLRQPTPLLAKPSELTTAVAARAAARGDGRWSEPVVLTDGRGVYVGVVRIPRILERLAAASH